MMEQIPAKNLGEVEESCSQIIETINSGDAEEESGDGENKNPGVPNTPNDVLK